MPNQPSRSGFSLLEVVIVTLILGLGAAVVLPSWMDAVQTHRVRSAAVCLQADIAAIQRASVRRGVPTSIEFSPGSATLVIDPPIPHGVGGEAGSIDYSTKFEGVAIGACDLNGTSSCRIDVQGSLVDSSSSQQLNSALITVVGESSSSTVNLLAGAGMPATAATAEGSPMSAGSPAPPQASLPPAAASNAQESTSETAAEPLVQLGVQLQEERTSEDESSSQDSGGTFDFWSWLFR